LPLLTSDFDYDLPDDRIAQQPNERRESSRLLVVDRAAGTLEHRVFADLADLIPAGDALVLNTSRVIRARLLGKRETGAPAEILLLHPVEGTHSWEALVHPGGKLRPGRVVTIAPELQVAIERVTERRTRIVRLLTACEPYDAIERFGHIPLPPYIRRPDAAADAERYQTVFARESGSVAAPTAGLHFSQALLDTLSQRGIRRAEIVLHVGAGTFKPVETEDPAQHRMHEEWFSVSDAAAQTLNETRRAGGHIWAVGTTVARTLETVVKPDGPFAAMSGETTLFIRPPYTFRAVDRLITNFHLPRSTLLMLVAAFGGRERILEAYRVALEQGYRFFSYGDAMLIR
jgi:S-adenosylmethionine:tRNA ribosyltransferase-isomerase